MKASRQSETQLVPEDRGVSFMTAVLSQHSLGLSKDQYKELVSRATLVIHNAWTVNFNLPLFSFRSQLEGLVNLLVLTNDSSDSARFLYVSSISSVMSHRTTSSLTAETAITADSAPGPNGYAESKYVAEQIINYAAQKASSNNSLAFARVGQIAGAVNRLGMWNRNEWFPSMIISSAHIGVLPDSLGPAFDRIDWVPVDLLANIVVELAMKGDHSEDHIADLGTRHADVYHLANPGTVSWSELVATVIEELSSQVQGTVELVPLHKWIARAREDSESMIGNSDGVDLEAVLRMNPAAKLLAFFEGLVTIKAGSGNRLNPSKTMRLSKEMRSLEPIKGEWIRRWVRECFAALTEHSQ